MTTELAPKSRKRAPSRGSKPGERRGGRQKGTPNKATADVRVLAAQYAPAALTELARLSTQAESEAARVAAIKELLDRAYGKSRQPVEHEGALTVNAVIVDRPPAETREEWLARKRLELEGGARVIADEAA